MNNLFKGIRWANSSHLPGVDVSFASGFHPCLFFFLSGGRGGGSYTLFMTSEGVVGFNTQ